LAESEFTFSRTPRPSELLTAPSSIISIPAASNAAISLTRESTFAPNHRFARLHALNGRHRKPRQFREPALIDAEKRPGSPQLSRCDHRSSPRDPNQYQTSFLHGK
jgi:hypothetical protein